MVAPLCYCRMRVLLWLTLNTRKTLRSSLAWPEMRLTPRGREDAVPKVAFGKFERQNERVLLPFSVEVHHALMDGFHMGQYLTLLEELIKTPETYLAPEMPR